MMQEPFAFGGWITPNFTMIPDQFFDEVMPHLSEAELRVLLYIMRRTFGFKKAQDNISLSQMVGGITTLDGKVLDQGCGLSKSAVAKGLKLLSEKRIITATRNQSREQGNLPTAYSLFYAGEKSEPTPLSTRKTRGCPPGGQGLVHEMDTQQTEQQETGRQEHFENSKDIPRMKIGDNLGITGYLDNLIIDISREFGDTAHVASNCKQARNIFAALDLGEEVFVEQYVYQARQKTKHRTKVRNKMAYFFATLREICGLEDVKEA
ncbi:MAG: replication protein [Thermomicrobia bacterium]|nr:replication protein [Thermomicrobia bacterium]MCA1723388.1 replication protein [Thermomicrobia bacterium]